MPYADKETQNKYKQGYDKKHYNVLGLKLMTPDSAFIKAAAKDAGMSNAQFVLMCVKEHLGIKEDK